jgi:predicted RNase H-like HicB family nuclease
VSIVTIDEFGNVVPSPIAGFTHEEALANARAAAEKGLAWIQESGTLYGLKKVDAIVLDHLDLSHRSYCVLGQLGKNYADAMVAIHGGKFFDGGNAWAQERGFQMDADNGIQYSHLNKVWRELLTEEAN